MYDNHIFYMHGSCVNDRLEAVFSQCLQLMSRSAEQSMRDEIAEVLCLTA